MTLLLGLSVAAAQDQTPSENPPQANPAAQSDTAPQPDEAPQSDKASGAAPAKTEYRYWTTHWSFQDVDVRKLADRLASIGVTLPMEVAGDVSVRFRVSVPLNGLREARAYRFEGSLSSNRLRIDALEWNDFAAAVRYRDGVLHLEELRTLWSRAGAGAVATEATAGTVRGSARVELVPRGTLAADLVLQRTAIGPLVQLLERTEVLPAGTQVTGRLDGQAELICAVDALDDPAQWQVTAAIDSPDLRINGSPPLDIASGPIEQRDGRLSVPSFAVHYAEQPDVRVTGSLGYEYLGRRAFEVRLVANDVPTQQVAAMLAQPAGTAEGKLDLRLRAAGQRQPWQWNVVAQVASPQLRLWGFDLGLLEHRLHFDQTRFRLSPIVRSSDRGQASGEDGRAEMAEADVDDRLRIRKIAADYELRPGVLELDRLEGELFGGRVEGQLTLVRGAAPPAAEHHIDVSWSDLRLPVPLPLLGLGNRMLVAESSGAIDWRVAAARWQRPDRHRGRASLDLRRLSLGDAEIGSATVQLSHDGRAIELAGSGELLGGTFAVSADSSLEQKTSWREVWQDAWRAEVKLDAADLQRAARLVPGRTPLDVGGKVSVTVAVQSAADSSVAGSDVAGSDVVGSDVAGSDLVGPQFTAAVTLQQVTYGTRLLSPQLQIHLRGDRQRLWLDRFEGRYAGGTWSGSGGWSDGWRRGQMVVRASSVDVSAALLPLWSEAPRYVDGYGSLTARLRYADAIRLSGAVQWHEGRLIEIPIQTGDAGFRVQVAKDLRSWRADLNRIQLRTLRGKWTGQASVASTVDRRGIKLASHWKADRVDFTDLFPTRSGPISLGTARASGELTLGGRSIRGLSDLEGRFAAELDGTEARAVPGLPDTQNYLGAVSLGSVRFDQGRMEGVIRGGAVVLDEFWLLDSQLRVFADGKIRLADGRMAIDAVLNTGDFAAQNILLRRLAGFAGEAAVPLSVVIQANELLSNRTLLVGLSGPVSNPRVKLKSIDTLRANATEFFLRQARRGTAAVVLGAALD
ncbi:AsmA-like C-terminal region-containing protein [Roseimaritima sediminicola]|uniref:AsmA-like C-terminal region-containing protein n=1 Tax=Roseimaritima sediminicola TaxID=2662066 RepID=UPI00129848C5|nr:AsmA-like C-terminal region-containing protein [Roseimaritima sediminicola]